MDHAREKSQRILWPFTIVPQDQRRDIAKQYTTGFFILNKHPTFTDADGQLVYLAYECLIVNTLGQR